MPIYTFTVVLGDQTEMTEELAEALAAAGCDDSLAGSSDGVAVVIFDREADSLEQAVRSAVADVQKAGCRAAWVRIESHSLPSTGKRNLWNRRFDLRPPMSVQRGSKSNAWRCPPWFSRRAAMGALKNKVAICGLLFLFFSCMQLLSSCLEKRRISYATLAGATIPTGNLHLGRPGEPSSLGDRVRLVYNTCMSLSLWIAWRLP